jgi:hypothetical protein
MLGRLCVLGLIACLPACSSEDASSGTDGGGGQTGGSGGSGQGGTSGGGSSQGGSSGSGGSGGSSSDPLDAARQACVDKINQLRATQGLPAFARWTEQESCADQQATSDEQNSDPHGSFGDCGEGAQNECLGGGTNIEGCLDSMWGEKDQAGCSGCDACSDAYNPSCPNCDFYGDATGDVCGHYVNMSAKYFSRVACGFSSAGGWATIDFD